MRRLLALAGMAGAVLALSGCAFPLPTDGPVATRHGTGGNMDALLEGTLRLDADCAWIEAEDGGYIPVFEVGVARFEAGELVFGGRYADGDPIQVGGGTMNGTTAGSAGADMYIPDGCPDLPLWAASPPFEA
jgi:hypothetical protein